MLTSTAKALAADSPIDSLGTYIHHNFTHLYSEVEQREGVCEGLS